MQEVRAMLITCSNEVSCSLPVLVLKSSYLDYWPNKCLVVLFLISRATCEATEDRNDAWTARES